MTPIRQRFAKIIATLGPSCADEDTATKIVDAGVDVFRINLSHEDRKSLAHNVSMVRAIEKKRGSPLGIVVDLEGPRFRIGDFAKGSATLVEGKHFRLDQSPQDGDDSRVPFAHSEAYAHIKVGQQLVLDDGRIVLRVIDPTLFRIDTEVISGGTLSNRKVIALGSYKPDYTRPRERDMDDIRHLVTLDVDWITLSWPTDPAALDQLRALTKGRVRLLAKVDAAAVLTRLDDVIAQADGLVIARGDLGYDVAPEDIPGWQKDITFRCRHAGKPVVVAAQMLDSMVNDPTPTRAEASDVANAVFDGADAVMLSAETAVGHYPLESVAIMDRIINEIEEEGTYWPLPPSSINAQTKERRTWIRRVSC